jgi:MFS family permease
MRLLKDKVFYGWVLVATFFLTNALIMGTNTSFGVFFKSLESEFDLTRATTSAIFSTRMILGAAVSFLGGLALDRYGPRIIFFLMGLFITLSLVLTGQASSAWQLFITFSLLLSLGTGASYVVVMSTVSRWFDKKRGMAVGITGAGGGMGQVVMAPFAAYLIANFNWRTAYVVIGIIAGLVVIPASRLLKRDPKEIGVLPDGLKADSVNPPWVKLETGKEDLQPLGLSLSQALRTRSFWLLMPLQVFTAFSVFLIMTHIVPHATDLGLSSVEAATILSLIGLAMMFGRVLIGTASDKIGRKSAALISSVIQMGGLVLLLWAKELWAFYLFAFIHGFTQGGLGTALTALFGDIFGLRNLGKLIGVINISWAVGAAIGPVVGGLIFDITGSYIWAFLLIVVVMAVRPLFIALIRRGAV